MLEQQEGLYKIFTTSQRLRRHEELDVYHNGDRKASLSRQYLQRTGKPLRLDPPVTFNEKLQWLKLYWRDPRAGICANKFTMRDFAEEKGFGHLLHPLLAVWHSAGDIDFSSLPDSFIIKAAHTSGMNLIVQNKHTINIDDVRRAFQIVMDMKYYAVKHEWVYEPAVPCLTCESLFQNTGAMPLDYKFFCFHGVVRAVQVLTVTDAKGLTDDTTACFCDRDLHALHLKYGYDPVFADPEMPECFYEMRDAAEALSADFPFVRVDFCVEGGKPWLGEFTFFPASGYDRFEPEEFDTLLGNWLNLQGIGDMHG